ncbi:MAG: formate dehydrogenase accessory sulfurtransferase FdhD [Verrucomicrobiota bacterium]|jgi:FdhD protein
MKRVLITRWEPPGVSRRARDSVAVEEPLELRVDTRPVAVIMRTPGHDEELAAGFLVSEGLIRARGDVRALRRNPRNRKGNVLDVFLAPEVTVDFSQLTRHVFASSSCGLCGKSSIASVCQQFPKLHGNFRISRDHLLALPDTLRAAQEMFADTGGLHAAALFDGHGRVLQLREDVGRHNAVDKVIGRAFLDGHWPLADCGLLVSGRTSFEIVQKALAAGISLVAAISAPTSLAVEFARRSGVTLIGFLRPGRFNVYAGGSAVGDSQSPIANSR